MAQACHGSVVLACMHQTPTVLAPMEGVSHPTFRRLVAEGGGVGLVCTEFVRISRAPLTAKGVQAHVVQNPHAPLSVQVMGNDADKMADAAQHVAEAGADVVDINLGCPAPRAVRKGVGSAMLKDVNLLKRVVGAMRKQTPCLLSAKIRAGFDDASHVLEIGRALQSCGIDFLAVHPRRRCDFYEGVADWRIIRALKDELSIPVIGNGDVWYAADALRMQKETGCDAVMIGRPALRNPFIFQQIESLGLGQEPVRPDGDAIVRWLFRLRTTYESELRKSPIGKLKEITRYVSRAVDDDRAFFRAAMRAPTLDTWRAEVERHLAGLPASRLDLDAHGTLGFERSGSASLDVLYSPTHDVSGEVQNPRRHLHQ